MNNTTKLLDEHIMWYNVDEGAQKDAPSTAKQVVKDATSTEILESDKRKSGSRAAEVNIYHGAFPGDNLNKRIFHYADCYSMLDTSILARAFKMFNAPLECLDKEDVTIGTRYHSMHHRSLSVGDVVEIDHVRYQCLPTGWSVGRTWNFGKAEKELSKV